MNNSFPKEIRLLSSRDFDYLRQDPSFVSSGLFLFFHKKSQTQQTSTRIGISVSKKVCSRAVGRNYIKRRIREVFRQSDYRDLGRDIMVVVNRKKFKSLDETKKVLKRDLLLGLKKISIS